MSTKSKRNKALYGTVGMTPVMAMMVTSTPAHAVVLGNQASTISLCSGVSLQRSDLTSVLAPLATSVSTLEGSTNTLLKGLTTGTVGTLLGNLGITGPVSTNIGGTLAAAETGNISLQAVNANGQLITPSGDCYAQANGLTLTNQKGISIGGNGVTGLGDNTKATGNAGELNSISIGNDSATDATSLNSLALGSQSKILANASESIALGHNSVVSAANSTALGSNSSVSVANSVALGQGSIASRGAQTNYTGFAVGTGQNSVGEVSVGTASGLRQITNLAPGSAGTDAVNVNQLSAVNDRVTGVNNIVTNNTNNINTLTNNLNITNNNLSTTNTNVTNLQNNIINGNIGPWRYSDGNGVPTGGTITNNITVIGGSSGPVYVHNIGNGVISASSTDAVNGSQLYTLQNSISNTNTTINNQITNLTNQYNSEDNRVTNLSNVVTNNANTVTNLGNTVSTLSNTVTNNTNSINNLNTSVSNLNTQVTQNTSDIQTNATNIANVDNRVTQVDNRVTDVDNRVTDVSNSVTNVSNRVDTLDSLAVKYDATSHTRITLGGGTGGTKITNLANGDVSATSTDAVNGGQLFTVNQTVNNAVTSLNNTVNQINTQIANNVTAINTVNNSVTAIDARVTNNTNAITDIGNTVTQNTADIATNATNITNVDNRVTNLAAVAVQYDGADHTRITFGGTGGTLLTNVKAGNVSANSSDAVNGAQLYTVQQSVTDATGNLGTQITNVDNRVTNVDNRVTAIDARTTNTETNVSNLTTSVNNIDNRVTNNTQSITNLNTQVTQNTTDIATNANAITNIDNRVTNVDNRVTSVNNTVNTLNSNFDTFSSQVADGGIGPVQYSNGGVVPNGGTPTQDLTLVGGTNGAVHLHNVANGVVAQGSTDAVNGGQIFDLENSVGSLSDLAVTYDDATKSSITLGGAGTSTAVALHNVAAGRLTSTSTDAVNGAQLYATNQSINDVQNTVGNIDNSITNINNSVTNIGNRVSQNTTDISNIDARVTNNTNTINTVNNQVAQNTTSITNLDGRVTTNATNIANVDNRVTNLDNRVTQNITDLGTSITNVTNQVSQNTSNISNLDARVTNNTNSINTINSQVTTINNQVTQNTSNITNLGDRATLLEDGGAGPVQYTNGGTIPNGGVPTNSLTLVGADNSQPVALHNVADGVVAHGSTDAVNGGQLFDAVQTGVSDLAVVYDDGSHSKVSLGGTGAPAVLLTNVKAGAVNAGSTDAVNGAQLFATNQSVSTVASSVTNVTNLYNTLNQTVANNTTDISNVTNNLNSFETNVANGGVGPVQYSDANGVANGGTPSQDLTLIGANAGPVGLHNVAAGLLGANSTDAVNGAQLAGLGVAMASKLGSMSYDPTTNSFTGNFTYDGTKYGDVQSVITAIQDDQGSTTTNGVATTSKYFNANSVASNSVASGTDSTAVGPSSTSSGDKSVAMGSNANAQSDQSVAIGSGATAKDGMAVSIGMGNTASGNGAVAIGDPSSATGDGAVVLGKDDNAAGTGAIALGNTNTSTGDGAAAIGNMNTANGLGAVALGTGNSASGLGSISIGSNNNVSGDNSLALGSNITTGATDTLAIGSSTVASANSAVALGNRAQATGLDSISVGTDTTATGVSSSTFGEHADSTGDYATAVGSQAQAGGLHSAAVGFEASASGIRSTALGADAVANADYTLAVGQMSTASARGGVAVGLLAQATGYAGTALGSGAVASQEGSVALGADSETQRGGQANYTAFGVTGAQTSLGEVAVARSISYEDLSDGSFTPTGNRQITGVAAGSADTDAVNVAQLKGVSSSIGTSLAQSLGGGATYNSTTGQITGPSYVLGGVTFTSVGDAIEALARSTGTSTGGGAGTPITVVDPNAVAYDNATTKDSVTLASGGTAVHNVANGAVSATSTDAVNGSQLNAVQTQVSTLASQVSNGAVGAVQYSNAATPTQGNGGTKTNDVTLVGANSAAPVALHNVADGNVASGSTDAVNGGQLAATNAHVATVETTANTALAMGQSSAQYDDSTHSSVTLGGAGDASAVGLHNVADGTSAHDAVNLGQLNSAAAGAVETANAYTDQQVKALSFDLSKVRKDSAAGVAGAMALAGMPQPYEAGRGMISGGVGAFLGQTAIAVGIAKAMSDEHTVIKAGATYNSRGQAGVNVGIGYMF